jgi:hypothetical protein
MLIPPPLEPIIPMPNRTTLRIPAADIRNVLIVIAVVLALWAPRLRGVIDMRWDGAVHYILGTEMAEGRGYRLASEPGEIWAIQYPPLLPSIVAVHELALGSRDPAVVGRFLRYTFFATNAVYAVAVYALARRWLRGAHALPIALLTTVSWHTIWMSDLLFAELPFALVTAAFALLHTRSEDRARMAAMGILASAAYLLRTAGLALLAAWVIEAAWHRRWRQFVARLGIVLIPIVAWNVYIARVESSREYTHPAYPYQRAPYLFYNVTYARNISMVDSFFPELGMAKPADLAARFAGNAARMPKYLGEAITAGRNDPEWLSKQPFRWRYGLAYLAVALATAIGFVILAGLGVLLVRGPVILAIYIALSVSLACCTPWPGQFNRYLTPLIPFLLLALCESLTAAVRFLERRWPWPWTRYGPACIALVLWLFVAKNAYTTLRTLKTWSEGVVRNAARWSDGPRHLIYYDDVWNDFDKAIAWLGAHADREDVVASSTPQWIYLNAGLKAVMPPMEADIARVQDLLDAVPVRYILTEKLWHADLVRRFLDGTIEAYSDRWELVYTAPNGTARVYRRSGLQPSGRTDSSRPNDSEPSAGAK